MKNKFTVTLLAAAITHWATGVSYASFHLWQIDEVYSNASGTIQFIEMFTASNGQELFSGHTFSSNSHSITLGVDLPSSSTSNEDVLFATPGYIALSGVPAADYSLGVNNFFSTTGDTLNWANANSLAFTMGQLPLDGTQSLNRQFNPPTSTTFTKATNSPTNFARVTGSVPEPSTIAYGGFVGLAALVSRRRARNGQASCTATP